MYYYILTLTDFDGKFEYHNIITTECNEKSQISIFPNPFKTKMKVVFPSGTNYPLKIELMDYLGRTVKSLTVKGEIPFVSFSLNENIPTWTYFLKIYNKDSQLIKKITKIN